MAKHVLGKLLAGTAAIAVVGGVVCYLNREKIKESETYKNLDVDNKINKVKNTIMEHIPSAKDEDIFDENEFFSDEVTDEENFSDRGYVTIQPQAEKETPAEDTPAAYENEGLSDSTDDPETLKEQDQLD